jgi:hypothetical protein
MATRKVWWWAGVVALGLGSAAVARADACGTETYQFTLVLEEVTVDGVKSTEAAAPPVAQGCVEVWTDGQADGAVLTQCKGYDAWHRKFRRE